MYFLCEEIILWILLLLFWKLIFDGSDTGRTICRKCYWKINSISGALVENPFVIHMDISHIHSLIFNEFSIDLLSLPLGIWIHRKHVFRNISKNKSHAQTSTCCIYVHISRRHFFFTIFTPCTGTYGYILSIYVHYKTYIHYTNTFSNPLEYQFSIIHTSVWSINLNSEQKLIVLSAISIFVLSIYSYVYKYRHNFCIL